MREFKVEANVGKPQVAYKETIRKNADSDMKYARQSGGKGQYGHVKIRIEPNPGKGYEFVNAVVGGTVPKDISRLLTRVSRAQCSPVYLQATTLLT
mgnify:FL=1